jgi:hypothetical protein
MHLHQHCDHGPDLFFVLQLFGQSGRYLRHSNPIVLSGTAKMQVLQ